MGVGKTERLGHNDSRFVKGRRVDEANDRILRNLKVKGGKIRKHGDKWVIEVGTSNASGLNGYNGTNGSSGDSGGSSRCDDCCNYEGGCDKVDDPKSDECAHTTQPDDAGGPNDYVRGSGWVDGKIDGYGVLFPGSNDLGGGHDDGTHPGKTGPCW